MMRLLAVTLLGLMITAPAPAATTDDVAAIRDDQRRVAELLVASYVFVGGGSGVLISEDGYILSNDHVTGGSWEWRVRLADGRSYTAEVVGTDPFGDISLLRIVDAEEGTRFTHVSLGEAQDIRPCMPILAIGNPFGLGDVDDTPTLTVGRLGSGRLVRGSYTDCVQVDAPVNPGNSGGPSLTPDGVLIGINGQIRTRTGMRLNSGVGLAIACTQIRDFLPLLRSTESGYVLHTAGPAGLELETREDGSVLVSAWEAEAASDAGLLAPGERLVAIAGRPVISEETAVGLMASLPWRGADTTIPVLVEDSAGERREIALPAERTPLGKPYHGLMVRVRDGEVRVRHVASGSPAAEAGVGIGWQVLRINGQPIERRLDWLKAVVGLEVGDQMRIEFRDRAGDLREVAFWLEPEGRPRRPSDQTS